MGCNLCSLCRVLGCKAKNRAQPGPIQGSLLGGLASKALSTLVGVIDSEWFVTVVIGVTWQQLSQLHIAPSSAEVITLLTKSPDPLSAVT